MWKHPKYYKELRKLRNKLDQAISDEASTEATSVRPGPGPKRQASSVKPQAASIKLEATSVKFHDTWATEKFQAPWTKVLNADKSIVWMFHMERNLMWWETYLVTLRDFKFYSEKGARIIIAQ